MSAAAVTSAILHTTLGRGRESVLLARAPRLVDDPPVLLILLLGFAPIVIWLTLLIALYLTVIELREMQPPPHFLWWSWWLLLVFMTHFVGYLILRAYAVYHRRHAPSG